MVQKMLVLDGDNVYSYYLVNEPLIYQFLREFLVV